MRQATLRRTGQVKHTPSAVDLVRETVRWVFQKSGPAVTGREGPDPFASPNADRGTRMRVKPDQQFSRLPNCRASVQSWKENGPASGSRPHSPARTPTGKGGNPVSKQLVIDCRASVYKKRTGQRRSGRNFVGPYPAPPF